MFDVCYQMKWNIIQLLYFSMFLRTGITITFIITYGHINHHVFNQFLGSEILYDSVCPHDTMSVRVCIFVCHGRFY